MPAVSRARGPWSPPQGLSLELLSWHLRGGDRLLLQVGQHEPGTRAPVGVEDAAAATCRESDNDWVGHAANIAIIPAEVEVEVEGEGEGEGKVDPSSGSRRFAHAAGDANIAGDDRSFSLEGLLWTARVTSLEVGKEWVRVPEVNDGGVRWSRLCAGGRVRARPEPALPAALSAVMKSKSSLTRKAFGMRFGDNLWVEDGTTGTDPDRDPVTEKFWARRAGGTCCDRPLREVSLPQALVHLELLGPFNDPVEGVQWPPSNETLVFGELFNQSLRGDGNGDGDGGGILLPRGLKSLTLGSAFDQPLDDVAWPPGLDHLQLRHSFSQDIGSVRWPSTLQEIYFGDLFRSPITQVTWWESLEHLAFGHLLRQPLPMVGVSWPRDLEELHFGSNFNQETEGTDFPDNLERLTFRQRFDHPIENVKWPKSLKLLEVKWPEKLEAVQLGQSFSGDAAGVKWPRTLKRNPNLGRGPRMDDGGLLSGIESSMTYIYESPTITESVLDMEHFDLSAADLRTAEPHSLDLDLRSRLGRTYCARDGGGAKGHIADADAAPELGRRRRRRRRRGRRGRGAGECAGYSGDGDFGGGAGGNGGDCGSRGGGSGGVGSGSGSGSGYGSDDGACSSRQNA
eukprot:g18017.t1